jgi:hypothetical protein
MAEGVGVHVVNMAEEIAMLGSPAEEEHVER